MFYLNLTHWLPFLLERKDRMGMATGLEVRLPFAIIGWLSMPGISHGR